MSSGPNQWAEVLRSRVNIYPKNLMGQDDLRTGFMDYVIDRVRAVGVRQYPLGGTFLFGGITTQLADAISVLQGIGIDNNGNQMEWPPYQNLPIPTGTGLVLYYGMAYGELTAEPEANPRTAEINYGRIYEAVGDIGRPDSVVDNGDGTITIDIHTIMHETAAVGREVRVQLETPATAGAEWQETCTVFLASGRNCITTVAALGQTNISTQVTDYVVWAIGPAISLTPLPANYVKLGYTTQATPASLPVWTKTGDEGVRWVQYSYEHHTPDNVPVEIGWPHKLQHLDVYDYCLPNLVRNSYWRTYTPSPLAVDYWTLATYGTGVSWVMSTTEGWFGYNALKATLGTAAGNYATLTGDNTAAHDNNIGVALGNYITISVYIFVKVGSLTKVNSGVSIQLKILDRAGNIRRTETLVDKQKVTTAQTGKWWCIYGNYRITDPLDAVVIPIVTLYAGAETPSPQVLVGAVKLEQSKSATRYIPHTLDGISNFGAGTTTAITTTVGTTVPTTTHPHIPHFTTWDNGTMSVSITAPDDNTSQAPDPVPLPVTTAVGACVDKDTLIALADGKEVPIRALRAGDIIQGVASNGKGVTSRVLAVLEHRGYYKLKKVEAQGRELFITPDHCIWDEVIKAYHPVERALKAGGPVRVVTSSGIVTELYDTEQHIIAETVYNLTTETHNYFANGVLISNDKTNPL